MAAERWLGVQVLVAGDPLVRPVIAPSHLQAQQRVHRLPAVHGSCGGQQVRKRRSGIQLQRRIRKRVCDGGHALLPVQAPLVFLQLARMALVSCFIILSPSSGIRC